MAVKTLVEIIKPGSSIEEISAWMAANLNLARNILHAAVVCQRADVLEWITDGGSRLPQGFRAQDGAHIKWLEFADNKERAAAVRRGALLIPADHAWTGALWYAAFNPRIPSAASAEALLALRDLAARRGYESFAVQKITQQLVARRLEIAHIRATAALHNRWIHAHPECLAPV